MTLYLLSEMITACTKSKQYFIFDSLFWYMFLSLFYNRCIRSLLCWLVTRHRQLGCSQEVFLFPKHKH